MKNQYRLIAMAVLPVDKGTIAYGSYDAGQTIHNSDDELNDKMKKVRKKIRKK